MIKFGCGNHGCALDISKSGMKTNGSCSCVRDIITYGDTEDHTRLSHLFRDLQNIAHCLREGKDPTAALERYAMCLEIAQERVMEKYGEQNV